MTDILSEANKIINGDRKEAYGDPKESFERIAKLWSVVLGMEVTPQQVNLCMMQLKISREMKKHKTDNLTDICGYAALLEKISPDYEPFKGKSFDFVTIDELYSKIKPDSVHITSNPSQYCTRVTDSFFLPLRNKGVMGSTLIMGNEEEFPSKVTFTTDDILLVPDGDLYLYMRKEGNWIWVDSGESKRIIPVEDIYRFEKLGQL